MARASEPATARPKPGTLRCAIYTRKSTEEGLDQAFNSLDAQREACAAYITSQRHEGWTMVPEHYDDGGYSGGSMERPGLKQLLADVAADKVDVIVVYKVDRLTRALSDFAKIVDVLDKAGASFVSITQAFNTTTSMGRLTLNVLLSFAQFEREVISERVRDKVAASKKKGMWMGGPIPLGYDIIDRKLVPNTSEAAMVNAIMQRYLDLGWVRALVEALAMDGMRTKAQDNKNGMRRGGRPFTRGMLYHLLANRTYRGDVTHKSSVYAGEHDAIVSEDLWNPVQAQLAANAVARRSRVNAREPSLLTGMIVDDAGRRMTPCHAVKDGRRYRYYSSQGNALVRAAQRGKPPRRIAAGDLEPAIIAAIREILDNPACLSFGLEMDDQLQWLKSAACDLRLFVDQSAPSALHQLLLAIGLRVTVEGENIVASYSPQDLAARLGLQPLSPSVLPDRTTLPLPDVIQRRMHGSRLIMENAASAAPVLRDGQLVTLLLKAQQAKRQLIDGAVTNATYSDQYLSRLARLAFLAPDITAAILDGTQPPRLIARQLLRAEIPLSWTEQRRTLGFV